MVACRPLRTARTPCECRDRSTARVWLLVAVSVVLAAPARAQYGVDSWTTEHGLPQNIIRAIHQTRDGYLWLSTLDGLVRFDGVRFRIFDRSNSPGIGSNRFLCLYESPAGDLWAGTEAGGVTRYHQGVFTTYTTQHGLPNDQVNGVTGDEAGGVWVLSHGQIMRWDNGRFRPALPHATKPFYASLWNTQAFWGADDTTLYRFTGGRLTTRHLPRELRDHSFTRFEEDMSGALWLVLTGGRVARVKENGQVSFYQVLDVREGSFRKMAISPDLQIAYQSRQGTRWSIDLDHELVRSLTLSTEGRREPISFRAFHEDGEANLWLGTEGQGLYRIRKQGVTAYSRQHGLVDRNVYPILEDGAGAIWIGAWTSGLSRFKDGRFTSYTPDDGLASGLVTALAEDKDGRLWVAAHYERNGGLRILQNGRFTTLSDDILPSYVRVAAIHHDPAGPVWLGTTHGLVRYADRMSTFYTVKDGLAGDDVRVIVAGQAGSLWIGSSGGLTQFKEGTFTRWTEREGLPSNNVRALYYDDDDVLWIGTYDGGLGRLKDGRLTRFRTADGLFNNGVFQILEDRRGRLWMCCNRGLHSVSKRELSEFAEGKIATIHSVSFGKSDGLLNAECNGGYSPAGIRARDGRLWFPTQDGVAVVDAEAFAGNAIPPPVVIESFLVDGRPVPVDQPVRIAPGSGDFEVHYTGLSLVNSARIRFRYRLKGLDRDWVEVGTRRAAYYSHVPPGEYTFTVIAANSDGAWNTQGASLSLVVVPPFWRTSWFVVLALLGVVGLAAFVHTRRVRSLERARTAQAAFSQQMIESQEVERKRIAAELHDSLGQNLLIIKNRAMLGSLTGQNPDAAREQLEEIAASATESLEEVRQIAYNLRPYHLDRLGLANSIEAMIERIGSASEIHFSTAIAQLDGSIPKEMEITLYRIVQEGVNNIVRHSQATRAWIEIARDGHELTVTIRDNGKGFQPRSATALPTPARGFGLTGIAERVRMLGGSHAVTSSPDEGTTIEVTLRFRNIGSGGQDGG